MTNKTTVRANSNDSILEELEEKYGDDFWAGTTTVGGQEYLVALKAPSPKAWKVYEDFSTAFGTKTIAGEIQRGGRATKGAGSPVDNCKHLIRDCVIGDVSGVCSSDDLFGTIMDKKPAMAGTLAEKIEDLARCEFVDLKKG